VENDRGAGKLALEVAAYASLTRAAFDPRSGGLRVVRQEVDHRRGAAEARAELLLPSSVTAITFGTSRPTGGSSQRLDQLFALDARPAPNDPLIGKPPRLGTARAGSAAIRTDVISAETQQFPIGGRHA
jgi:hypothetical protein